MDRRDFLWGVGACFSSAATARAQEKTPRQILIIRHAEKSNDKSDIHLNARGKARAAALVRLFPEQFDTPEFIFASKASLHSNRPVETVTPLADALHLTIDNSFPNEDYAALARELLASPIYKGRVILVCWHHGKIPALAAALGVGNPPSPWPDSHYERVWRLDYGVGGVRFTDAPQHLLPGDL